MRENRTCGSEGGEAQLNEPSLPLSPIRLRLSHTRKSLPLLVRKLVE